MNLRHAILAVLLTVGALLGLAAAPALAQNEIYIPMLVYRTGPYAPNGIPTANGYRDYVMMLNARDKGINGIKVATEECEMQYDTKQGVECYEKLKGKGPVGASLVNTYSTGITYQVIPKSRVDQIPVHTMGYGQSASGDGRVFEWAFPFPATYWSQATVIIKYISAQEGGTDKLKGKKIALVYHNSPYGKEPIAALEALKAKFGFDLQLLPVDHPGQEQKATWLQVRRSSPDYVLLWGWGVMNSVAVKEAAAIDFKMDHLIGVWWSGSEADVVPAGDAAKGYKAINFHGIGTGFQVHDDVLKLVYGGDRAKAGANNFGEVHYNRGLVNAMFDTEAIRTAMAHYGNRPLKGSEVRWGFENLNVTAERLKALGMENFVQPIKITCTNHESSHPIRVQQWDGKQWTYVSDWIAPMQDVVRPMIEQAAAAYGKENNIATRSCS